MYTSWPDYRREAVEHKAESDQLAQKASTDADRWQEEVAALRAEHQSATDAIRVRVAHRVLRIVAA